MMKAPCLLLLLLAMLSGCATESYYTALSAQYELDLARHNARVAEREKAKALPLVNFSWTDEYGVSRQMIVNQPQGGYMPVASAPVREIPSPWDGPYHFFDRTLSTVERFAPWIIGGFGQKDSGNTTYTFGDDAYFQQSRDNSPIDFAYDNSTFTDASTEEVTHGTASE